MKNLETVLKNNCKSIIHVGKWKTTLLTTIIFCAYSCSSNQKKESETVKKEVQKIEKNNTKKDNREKKIELISFYSENPSFTDKNGITFTLRTEKIEVNKRKMYESEKIFYKSRYDDINIIVSSFQIEEEFQLFSNGELKDVVKIKGYRFDSKRSDSNSFGKYCSDSFVFYPELNSKKTKKKRISDFTGTNCGMGEEVNNKVKNARIKAVQNSGILDNTKIEDFTISKPKETLNIIENIKFKITEDNLRVRTSPNLDAEKIENLAINSEVTFLNEKSDFKVSVTNNNQVVEEFWYKVKTPSDKIGWIHGCCFERN